MAKVLIVGCGDIGFRVGSALHDRGHRVVGLKRREPHQFSTFPIVTADICEPSALSVLPTEFDLVLFIVSAGARQVEAYRSLYVTGLNNVLAHFSSSCRPPRWLMVSSTSVYGQDSGDWVDEDSITAPAAETAQILVAAEKNLWQADDANCVVRFSGIYGPGRNWLLRRVEQGEPVRKQPPVYTNRIHRDDCVAVLLFLIEKLLAGEVLRPCYLASDNEPAPLWDVSNWIAAQYGYPEPEALATPAGVGQNKRCSNARLLELGYRFRFPSYRHGYRNAALS